MGDNDGNVKSGFKNNSKNSNRILFIVHREQIAKQAMKSYKNVFGRSKTYGLLSGNSKDIDADILFATMQMMSKEEVMTQFQKDCFKTIVIDEAHRTGAASYKKIMDYFEPEFWLGMTASPERTDDFDVFATFDHNIALEIRLQQAMEENLLCPFHYFGITDMEIDGVVIDEKTTKTFPVFINYDKSDDIQDTIKYEDHFTSRSSLIAISKQSRTVESEDVQNFLHAKERGITVELFVRKNKDDKISKEFYYLGRMTATGNTNEFIMANTDKTAVEIEWKLDTPVREDIYQYIVNG